MKRRLWKPVFWLSAVILAACLVVITGFLSVAVAAKWTYAVAAGAAVACCVAAHFLRKHAALAPAEEALDLVHSAHRGRKDVPDGLDVFDD